mgnify:CR=1 FL=1
MKLSSQAMHSRDIRDERDSWDNRDSRGNRDGNTCVPRVHSREGRDL